MCSIRSKNKTCSKLGRILWFFETDLFADANGEVVLVIINFSFLCSERNVVKDVGFCVENTLLCEVWIGKTWMEFDLHNSLVAKRTCTTNSSVLLMREKNACLVGFQRLW